MEETKGLMKYQATDGTEIELTIARVKNIILQGNKDVSDSEIIKFMMLCKARQLNPFTKDAYMTSYKQQNGAVNTSVVVSKDYFVRQARQTPTCDGWKTGVIVWNKRTGTLDKREGSIYSKTNEELVGAWAEVYDKQRSIPCMIEVARDEYDTGKSLWKTKPVTMLRKVALVQALRESYPQTFAGLYDTAEMPQEDVLSHQNAYTVETLEPTYQNAAEETTEPAGAIQEDASNEVIIDADENVVF